MDQVMEKFCFCIAQKKVAGKLQKEYVDLVSSFLDDFIVTVHLIGKNAAVFKWDTYTECKDQCKSSSDEVLGISYKKSTC